MARSHIGDSYDSLIDFRLYDHPYSSDISKQGICLPLKHIHTSVNTDSKVLSQLGITEEESPVYNFLGLQWDMKAYTLIPNSYFALGKRKAGLKSGSINENDEGDDFFLVGETITCRLLSLLCSQRDCLNNLSIA